MDVFFFLSHYQVSQPMVERKKAEHVHGRKQLTVFTRLRLHPSRRLTVSSPGLFLSISHFGGGGSHMSLSLLVLLELPHASKVRDERAQVKTLPSFSILVFFTVTTYFLFLFFNVVTVKKTK